MTREDAIDIIQLILDKYEEDECLVTEITIGDEDIKAFKMAIEVLEQESRWISVSERLPKAGEYVGNVAKYYLVQNEYGDMLVARYTHSEYWEQMYQLKPVDGEIVAWMPLPKPYKAESEG